MSTYHQTYRQLCQSLIETGATIQPVSAFSYDFNEKDKIFYPRNIDENKKYIIMRHDVDYSPFSALKMAQVEASLGLASTYYILLSHDNKKLKKLLLERLDDVIPCLKKIQDLGHEIGLHYDFFGDYFSHKIDPYENLMKSKAFFEQIGIKIKSAAAHGSHRVRKKVGHPRGPYPVNYINFNIWKESRNSNPTIHAGTDSLDLPALSLTENDLCEPYFIDWDWYLSDSGGNFWGVARKNDGQIFESLKKEKVRPENAVKENLKSGQIMQILVHPVWWAPNGNLG